MLETIAKVSDHQAAGNDAVSQRQFNIALIATTISAFALYLVLATFSAKFSRAEVFFAECSREMLEVHNYVTPLYHMQPFFDKPILVYWLIIGMFKIFGISHWAARLPSIVAACVSVAVTGLATANLFGRRSGAMAAAMLASSFMFFSFAALCMSDMLLLLFDLLTLVAAYAGIKHEDKRLLYFWLSALSMGLGFTVKGPIAVVLPAAAIFLFLLATRQLGKLKPIYFFVAMITIAAVASPWFYAAYKQNGTSALIWFFIRENLGRFAGATYDAHRPFWYMITTFFLGFAPWSIFVPFALVEFVRQSPGKPRTDVGSPKEIKAANKNPILAEDKDHIRNKELFLWLWIATAVGFFCFSRGKCDYYSLPAYPAAAALAAYYLDSKMLQRPGAIRVLFICFAVAFFAAALGCTLILPTIAGSASGAWLAIPGILFLAGAIVLTSALNRKLTRAYAASVFGIMTAIAAFMIQIMPQISALQPMGRYAGIIAASPINTKIFLDGSLYHWIDELSFQTGRHPKAVDDSAKLDSLINENGSAIIIIPQTTLEKFTEKTRAKLKIMSLDHVITHKLTPGYVFERQGDLLDPTPIVVASKAAE